MAADVEVVFGAEDSALRAAIDGIKAKMGELDQKAVELGKKIAAAFTKMGITPEAGFKLAGKEEQDALAQYGASLEKVEDEIEKVGEATTRTGINFGRMVERMAVSLLVFGAIREAIKGIHAAMAEATTWETISTRFKNLSLDAAGADKELAHIAETAKKIGASKDDMAALELSLQKGGASAAEAAAQTETLAEYATVAGEKMGPLGDEMSRLAVGAGTIADMEHLVSLMGSAGQELHDQIIDYQIEQVMLRQDEELIARNAQLQQRAIAETTRLEERAYEQQQRHNEAVTEFGDHLGVAKEVFQDIQSATPVGRVEVAGVDVTAQAEFLEKRERAGEEQIEQEENLSLRQLRRLEAAGLFNEKDLLAAAQRAQEADRLGQKNAQEDARTTTRNAQEDAAYNRRRTQEEEFLKLQGEVYTAVEKRTGLTEHLAAVEHTAAAATAKTEEKLKAIADHSTLVGEAIKSWNTFLGDTARLLEGVDKGIERIRSGWRTTVAGGAGAAPPADTGEALQLLQRSAVANEGVHAAMQQLTAP